MSQQQRSIQQPLLGAILLCLLVGVSLLAWKWLSKPDPSVPIKKHPVDTSPEETLKYWTADKMRKAKPANMPQTDALEPGKRRPRRSSRASRPHTS